MRTVLPCKHVHTFQHRIVTARAPLLSPQALSSNGASHRLQEVEDPGRKDMGCLASLSQAQEGRNKSSNTLQDNVTIYPCPILALACLPQIKHQTIPFVYLSELYLITVLFLMVLEKSKLSRTTFVLSKKSLQVPAMLDLASITEGLIFLFYDKHMQEVCSLCNTLKLRMTT